MGEHRTPESKQVIDALVTLGQSLGYDVRREWEIPGTGPHPERIDITFFVDQRANSPAFVIEVDSADIPASTSNVVKIFGKTTSALVKPFFVFHIFITTATEGHRRQNAETAFSTHNYKSYDFRAAEERATFLRDLLARHRAIRATIDLHAFGLALDDAIWDATDRYATLDAAAEHLDPGEKELADVALLSLDSRSLREALSRFVIGPRLEACRKCALGFTGSRFTWPLLMGLQAHVSGSLAAASVFREFREWQEDTEIIFSAQATYLGLSREFDFAICELAPPMFCFVALLFAKDRDAARQVCQQLYTRAADGNLGSDWACYALAWCVIASLKIGAADIAQRALDEINRLGGMPAGTFPLLTGPTFSEDGPTAWETKMSSSPKSQTPSLSEIEVMLRSLPPTRFSLPELVARILIDDEFASRASDWLVRSPLE